MKTIKATKAKQKFGMLMDMCIKEPVIIERYKRHYAVVMSMQDYECMKGISRIRPENMRIPYFLLEEDEIDFYDKNKDLVQALRQSNE